MTYNLVRTVKMGKGAAAIRNEFHTRLGQIARELGRELYPQGLPRGTRFSVLEAIAGALGAEMARQLIEIHIREQADDWPEDELGECPVCGGPARKAPDQPRVLTTTRGDVAWKQRVGNCPRCRRVFFPQNQALGIDHSGLSPRVQQKIAHSGVNSVSDQQASRDLAALSDLRVAPKPVERLVRRIGQERTDQRDVAVPAHRQLPLMAKDNVANPNRPCPSVAMVSVDGGRLQMRSEPSKESESKPTSHRRESKVAVLETYQSDVHQADPDPDVPRCFLDLKRTMEAVRGLGHALPVGLEFGDEDKTQKQNKPAEEGRGRAARPGRPERLVRSVLASRECAEEFGPMMHQAAWERNFFGAARRVFLWDGLPVNWTIQRRHFAPFTPIVDFVHALSYVFAASFAGRPQAEGAVIYERWIQAVWSGQVATILPELENHLAALGPPPSECAESDPRKLVFEALRYLKNNAPRMRYDEYRCQGLPIMTSAVESVIKIINRRVKGSEKFWSGPGAEAILQLRADYLSETETMDRFWSARETDANPVRPYRRSA